jgi:DNA polymerase III alpha subunit (gram-positive type)
MPLSSLPIAITDLETSGTNPQVHEILEIGLLVIDQGSLEILDSLDVKVRPEHLETAAPNALVLNGYNSADWAHSISLRDAIRQYAGKTKNAVFCSHNVTFDWSFMNEAFRKTGEINTLDYHRLDLFTMAWTLLKDSGIDDFNLSKVARFLNIGEEPLPHRAITGARFAYAVFRALATRELAGR